MPDKPRRVILETSKEVKRRWQRSNQRFQFTASQIAQLDRREEREKKAKKLREKEKKRIANKKRKAEQEAQAREERKRRGIPDPNARVSSSQPMLSMFLGAGKRQSPAAPEPAPTVTELEVHDDNSGSAGGDTEAESDDLDEVLENELSELQDADVPKEPEGQDIATETRASSLEEDEFSDCSAFDDEEILKKADTAAIIRATDEETKSPPIPKESSYIRPSPAVLTLESSFDSFQYDPADFLEAEAAIITQTKSPGTRDHSPPKDTSSLQPPLSDRPCSRPTLASSFGDSFRDETADWIEEVFARGSGDPFDELNKEASA
ncbi:hypothetical protein CBS147332_4533 [Penicillium roqueforti]|nr:hypothetical protein CBS147332_4533 [Penicillium roqueforti]KAI3117999.1 hypothetical protein CBS147331_2938 [Penicillium roqueforti]